MLGARPAANWARALGRCQVRPSRGTGKGGVSPRRPVGRA
ncbi:hypothetical protein roselon_02606 [Roseibacterium elongatum DSM 19469]|uniref:Uncharacterized protein n=1 Tax=Roseicyclus elongatus DSM 19469 TaxID=1294273 RepID=W8S432_9RHOB|nr:hypothetical protein roselon_02606 [Roseibacterium elongatum DSM 19469]